MGVHQKIDRVAFRHLKKQLPQSVAFPALHGILHFEGLNGPDGIKRKSPGQDEPWHYIDPANPSDRMLIDMINDHIYNLAAALKGNNYERACFEAAWMAHAIVDGLTPAHHYPLEAKLEELRGEGMETRITKKAKIIIPGKTRRHQLRNNWEYWGAKGVMTTHLSFELGVATTVAGLRFDVAALSDDDIHHLEAVGFEAVFREALRDVAARDMYKEFSRLGWTRRVARETKDVLVPDIIRTVALGWYQAAVLTEPGA